MGVNVQTLPHRSVNVEPIVSIMDALLCSRVVCGDEQASQYLAFLTPSSWSLSVDSADALVGPCEAIEFSQCSGLTLEL